MPKLSQYELDREANIARNRALLEQLELKQAVENLEIPRAKGKGKGKAGTKAKPIQPSTRVKRERSEPEAPRRQSARLKRAAIDASESPTKKRKREEEDGTKRAEEEERRLEAEERARKAKRPRHQDLKLIALTETEPQNLSSLTSMLHDVASTSHPRRVESPNVYDFDDKKDQPAVQELQQRLSGMKIVSRAKVTQDRIYSAVYHPDVTKDLVFFGDKHGSLGIWDARAPQEEAEEDGDTSVSQREGGKYWRLQQHWPATSKSSISAIKLDPTNTHNLYTSSYDCTIRRLSFTAGVSQEVYATNDRNLICNFDLTPSGNEMWISDGAGGVTHIDLRESKGKPRRYELSDQKIGCISINPTRPNFLLTASNSRLLKIWDARKLQIMVSDLSDDAPLTPPASLSDESATQTVEFSSQVVSEFMESKKGMGCLRGESRHDKSVSSAYWDPRGRQIVSTSYDDTLRLWDINSGIFESNQPFPPSSMKPFSRIRHNCQTGKWLTILRAQWSPNPDVYPHFVVADMDRSLDIFSCKGDLVAKLSDDSRVTAVQAVVCSHPSIVERAVTGNASGRCVLWAPEDV